MNGNIKAIFKKYLSPHGNIIEKDKLTLDNWYELEETAYEAKKISGDDYEKWDEITEAKREFDCLMGEIKSFINKLGGKVKAERERAKSGQSLSEMPKEFNWSWINRGGKNQSTL